MASTLTLQNVVDYSRTQTRLIPIVGVGGLGQEPALSICNDVMQEVLSSPYAWRFNRAAIPAFTTVSYQQDYLVTGATVSAAAASANSFGSGIQGGIFPISMTPNGASWAANVATLTTTYAHTLAIGNTITVTGVQNTAYNGVFTVTAATSTSVSYALTATNLGPSGAAGLTNINWLERCTLQDFANTSPIKPVHQIEVVANLPTESIIQPPFKLSYQLDSPDQPGGVIFRTWPVASSQIWTVLIDYQIKPPIFSNLMQTWAPWPDEMGYVMRQGFLAKALQHAEDPRAAQETQKFQMYLLKALDIKDQEIRSESFFPERPVLYGG